MEDLISRAAAMAEIEEYIEEYSDLDENGYHSLKWCAMEEARDVLSMLPAVDAAPVVRCKDCICYDDEPGGTLKMCYCGLGWTSPDDYCSKGLRGKKMDGDTE